MGQTLEAPAAQLNNILQKRFDKHLKDTPDPLPQVTEVPNYNWIEMDETEVAQQICILEFSFYRSISAKETLNLNWSKHKERSPNVLEMIEQFNMVGHQITFFFPLYVIMM